MTSNNANNKKCVLNWVFIKRIAILIEMQGLVLFFAYLLKGSIFTVNAIKLHAN